MLALIRTLYQICLLRTGPEVIPASAVFLMYAVIIWLVTVLLSIELMPSFTAEDARIAAMSSILALAIYAFTLTITRKASRIMPTLTAMLGCGSLISFGIVVVWLGLSVIDSTVAIIAAQLLLFWSVPVKGHILARALGVHWYLGIAIAIAVFAMQLSLSMSMSTEL